MSKREAIFLITIVVVVIGGFYYYMKYVFEPAPKQPADVLVANTDAKPAQKANDKRPDYITAWWSVINWEFIGKRAGDIIK